MSAPAIRRRVVVALSIGLVAALLTLWSSYRFPAAVADFDQTWVAARALLAVRDPYPLIGPNRAFHWPWQWAYPATAGVAVMPLAGLELFTARSAFAGVGAALLAFGVTRHSWVPLTTLASGPFLVALALGQWSPYIAAGMLMPAAFGGLLAVKPNMGLVAMAGMRARDLVFVAIAGGVLVTIAFLLVPSWPLEWRAAVESIPRKNQWPYIMRPGGFLLLLAALRWRRPEARVLLACAVLPGTPSVYDALVPLVAIVALGGVSLRVALMLSLCTFTVIPFVHASQGVPFDVYVATFSVATLVCLYLPMLVVVLCGHLRHDLGDGDARRHHAAKESSAAGSVERDRR